MADNYSVTYLLTQKCTCGSKVTNTAHTCLASASVFASRAVHNFHHHLLQAPQGLALLPQLAAAQVVLHRAAALLQVEPQLGPPLLLVKLLPPAALLPLHHQVCRLLQGVHAVIFLLSCSASQLLPHLLCNHVVGVSNTKLHACNMIQHCHDPDSC